ncbi:hypothetical protein BCV70DRAFT_72459 [Testicularia cyperi]|uniref:Uncharacterized protein n=1 Tax=Testicularia cyperi TaxID=1882483 RepID=A0A317XVM3_9BASI|nr:hypothetical protein BCV70DRAFT_72459 [Testicularia cyperi]
MNAEYPSEMQRGASQSKLLDRRNAATLDLDGFPGTRPMRSGQASPIAFLCYCTVQWSNGWLRLISFHSSVLFFFVLFFDIPSLTISIAKCKEAVHQRYTMICGHVGQERHDAVRGVHEHVARWKLIQVWRPWAR